MQANQKTEVRPAHSFSELRQSFRLVYDQYLKSGYTEPTPSRLRLHLRDLLPGSMAFVGVCENKVVATATGVRNGKINLPAMGAFKEELRALQSKQRRIVESTKFACSASSAGIKQNQRSDSAITCQLIKWFFGWCQGNLVDDWLMVVNPTHCTYYEKNFGFERVSEQKNCSHVSDHPGILLKLDVSGILSGAKQVGKRAQRLFLRDSIPFCSYTCYHTPTDEEIAALVLEAPELLSDCEQTEIDALLDAHPALASKVPWFFKQSSSFGATKYLYPNGDAKRAWKRSPVMAPATTAPALEAGA
ncbi:hypothetical protein OAO01_04405, partial [Oligoflexia bacterium]|nr:hypothetical protein [Oligoflexia bacterium]